MDVLIMIGSERDREKAKEAEEVLRAEGVSFETVVASAHRNPEKVEEELRKDFKVVIAMAGLSAALPGFIASKTKKPVIGVPLNVKLEGLDALLSTMQMPSGIPVACVGIDNAKNAALFAIRILSVR